MKCTKTAMNANNMHLQPKISKQETNSDVCFCRKCFSSTQITLTTLTSLTTLNTLKTPATLTTPTTDTLYIDYAGYTNY